MTRLALTTLSFTIAATLTAMTAVAAPPLAITLYRSDAGALYSNGEGTVDAGYATVHEQRSVAVRAGDQTIHIDHLPTTIDSEAVNLAFASDGIEVTSQRLLWPGNANLAGDVGKSVTVIGSSGQNLASGNLVAVDGNTLTIDDASRGTVLVRHYAAIAIANATARSGATLEVALKASHAGTADAQLNYVTAGLGWRAAYTGVLGSSDNCTLALRSEASIANRSGRDWQHASLKLVAGEPHFAKPSAPRPVMMRAMTVSAAAPTPEQASMGDYRSYTLAEPVKLPNGSVTQVPLYQPHTIACTRTWLYENGNAWEPREPMLNRNFNDGSTSHVSSHLGFEAFNALPAGYLRVLGTFNGQREFLGSARIGDTTKGQSVDVTLGQSFDLRGERERTAFKLDRGANTLDEAWRITLTNGGDVARSVTVREHPNRWRNWTLVSSSSKPVKQNTETLDFKVKVPAHGKATVDYAVRYSWTAADEH